MKRIFPYPILFVAAIVLDRVAISSTQIGVGQSLRALVFLLFVTTLTLLIVQYFVKDWLYTNFIVLMIPVALIAYRAIYGFFELHFPHQVNILGLALILLMVGFYIMIVRRKLWKSIRNPAQLTTYFSVVFGVLLIFQAVRLGGDSYRIVKKVSQPQPKAASTLDDPKLEKGSSPDIYVIVLDGYGRKDVLQDIYGYDNSQFIGELERRGFYVASENHSNYIQTPYSMNSFWNFDHIQPWDKADEYAQYLFDPIQNNRAFRSLNAIGYTTVSLAGSVHFAEIRTADVYLSPFLPLNDFETLLLVDSPVEPLSNIFDLPLPLHTYKTHHRRTLYQLEMLKKIPADIPGPKIVYAHIVAPHPPFIFDKDGNYREPERPYTLAEGTEFKGGKEEYWKGYKEQVIFVNREILKVVDAILTKSKTPPIILLMGDHGPGSMFRWDLDAPGCLWERSSNLYALLLPGHQDDDTLYPSITPVNTFRVIFNTYFGTDLPLLEDNSYLMIWHQPTRKIDVTSRRDLREGCTIKSE